MTDSRQSIVILSLFFIWISKSGLTTSASTSPRGCSSSPYNPKYPLTAPATAPNGIKYRIAVVCDLDEKSVKDKVTISHLKKGYLTYNPKDKTAKVEWDKGDPVELSSGYSFEGQGTQLSELVVFNGKLITADDKTGIVYEIDATQNLLHPLAILTDGDGSSLKGMKAEWASVKDEILYVGSVGTERKGKEGVYDKMWIKTISTRGEIKHIDWKENYLLLRRAAKIEQGYMVHESGEWSSVHKRWFFLPRRSSKLPYDPKTDEQMGSNLLLSANANFSKIRVKEIGAIVPELGYSSFKFVPDTEDTVIVAIKTKEVGPVTATFITVFTITGEILLKDEQVSDEKYEGIEFI